MTLMELLVPAAIALVGTITTTLAARRLDKAKANKEESSAFLVWTQEFRDAMNRAIAESEKTKEELRKSNQRIDELEVKMEEANKCNDSLQDELDQVKREKVQLQERVAVLEDENNQLRILIEELRKKKR
jgi:chromosome segregation ATPase